MMPPPRIGKPSRQLALAACLLLAVVSPALAAGGGASVAASLSDSAVDAGEQAQYRISVTNIEVYGY